MLVWSGGAPYNPGTMRRIRSSVLAFGTALTLGVSLTAPGPVSADTANKPSLVISQLKVTSSGGQFVTLYNATDSTLDMGRYQLEYFNSYDLAKATSSRLIALSGTVPPHGYFMINDDSLLLCYRTAVDSVSLGFSSTAGMVEVVGFDQAGPGGSAVPELQDYVTWSKKDAAGAQTLPADDVAFLQRQYADGAEGLAVSMPGAGGWQAVRPDIDDPCALAADGTGTIVRIGSGQLLPTAEPPATILTADPTASPAAALPSGDIGLMAPSITEILPNPEGKGNDSTSEFIELYNPNVRSFDLTGFSLQSGTTSLHTYTFPKGTGLPAHGFQAFYSSKTGLSLSNSGGQARLLDPFGDSISATAQYGKAKDGIAWALARGRWYWTTEATPGKANVIKQPPVKKKTSKTKSAKKGTSTSSAGINAADTASASAGSGPAITPIHLRSLVLVAGLAILYGAYEYRADLANGIYRFRRHHGVGDEDRQ